MAVDGVNAQRAFKRLNALKLSRTIGSEQQIVILCCRHGQFVVGMTYQLSTDRSTIRLAKSVSARLRAEDSVSVLGPLAK